MATYHQYDAVGLRESLAVSAPSASSAVTYFGFDAAGRMTHVVCPGIGTAYYEYDPVGNLVRKSVVTPEGPGPHTYFEYDPANRYASILNCHSDDSPACYFEYEWDAASRITLIRRENRDSIYYGYDEADRLTSERWQAAEGGTVYAFQWDYDLVGNRVYESAAGVRDWLVFRRWKTCLSPSQSGSTSGMASCGQAAGPALTYYEHDAANELIRSRQIGGDHPGYTYYAYDSRGNCTRAQSPQGTQYFGYDDRNLIESIRYRDGWTQYFHHDAQMRMYCLEDVPSGGAAEQTYFIWDKNGLNPLMERNGSGTVIGEYAHGYVPIDGSGSPIAIRKVVNGVPHYQYPLYNHHGDVIAIVDESGNIVARYAWNAWGETLSALEPPGGNWLGWQANWLRFREGVYENAARIYRAEAGTFAQRDPASPMRRLGSRPHYANSPFGRYLSPPVEPWDGSPPWGARMNQNEELTELAGSRRAPSRPQSLYASCMDPLCIDPSGLWAELRDAVVQPRRRFCAERNRDDPAELARRLHLAEGLREMQSWLTPYKTREQVRVGDVVSVPNKGIVDVNAYGFLYTWAWIANVKKERIAWYRKFGLLVEVSTPSTGSRNTILAHMGDPDLYMYTFIGHGAKDRRGQLELKDGSFIGPARVVHHALAWMALYACYTHDAATRWATNVPLQGWLDTIKGALGLGRKWSIVGQPGSVP